MLKINWIQYDFCRAQDHSIGVSDLETIPCQAPALAARGVCKTNGMQKKRASVEKFELPVTENPFFPIEKCDSFTAKKNN